MEAGDTYRVLHRILIILVVSKCFLGSGMPDWKYCRQIGPCRPGQHIMCMYYNPASALSTNCNGNPMDITMENREIILTKINNHPHYLQWPITDFTVPSSSLFCHAAKKKCQTEEWDDELARFAQVWANQCSFKNANLCRATERFSDPGQFMGGIEYAYPNIEDYSAPEVLARAKIITRDKANDIIEAVLNLVYDMKNYVTKDMVLKYVDKLRECFSDRSNIFLLAVHGNTTHIGCAMSYWIVMNEDEVNSGYDYYKTALVCNLSAQPVEGQKVYETSLSFYQQSKKSSSEGYDSNKNDQNGILPSVVLMPIINKEDELSTNEMHKANQLPSTNQQRKINKQLTIKITDRYFNMKPVVPEIKHQNNETVTSNSAHFSPNMKSLNTKHDSVFSRVENTELRSRHPDMNIINYKEISRDNLLLNNLHDALRLTKEDFSRLKELMSKYSAKEQIEALNLIIHSSTTANTLKSHTYSSVHATASPNLNNFIEVMDKELVHAMYDLVQKSGVGIDEIVNVTANIIHNDKATNNAGSNYDKIYRENVNHNNDEYKTIANDAKFMGKQPEVLEFRKQNPLLQYGKSVITNNNENRDIDYSVIENNIRNIRKTADLHTYRNNPTSNTSPIDRNKNPDYYSLADVTGRRTFDEEITNNHEEAQKNRGSSSRQSLNVLFIVVISIISIQKCIQ